MDASLRQLQLQTLLDETSAACVAASDETGRLTMFSPALERLFGQPLGDYAESQMSEQFGLYDADNTHLLAVEEVPLARARAGEIVHDAVITARVPRRPLLHLVCNGAPVRDEDGSIVGAVLVVKDVTAERNAVREQVELRRHLARAINHELRTPLAALLGHVDLLHDLDDDVPKTLRRPLATIEASAWRLRDLVQTVSDLIELEGDTQTACVPCDLGGLVDRSVVELGGYAEARQVALACTVPEESWGLLDPAKLFKAVLALVQNAITHAPRTSTVDVAVTSEATSLTVQVCDVGHGIPADHRTRMLRAFQRGGNVPEADTGRGLGLTVAHTVAVAHGGRLELTDHHPRGLCARLVLPRVKGAVGVVTEKGAGS